MSRITNTDVHYYLDGIDFINYGVHISASKGVTSSLKLKKPLSTVWPDYHGECIDLAAPKYEAREISLDCFLEADNKEDFLYASSKFIAAFDKKGTRRLKISVGNSKPLVYEVYCPNVIEINKRWNSSKMIGTFTLSLVEPEPVKKVLSFTSTLGASEVSVTICTTKLVNIYWGDGTYNSDVYGNNKTLLHKYSEAGTYEIIITGVIEEIKKFETNATILWDKL